MPESWKQAIYQASTTWYPGKATVKTKARRNLHQQYSTSKNELVLGNLHQQYSTSRN